MWEQKHKMKYLVVVLLSFSVFPSGCGSYQNVDTVSSVISVTTQPEVPSEALMNPETEANPDTDSDIDEKEDEGLSPTPDQKEEIISDTVSKDLDGNGIMDAVQRVTRYDGSEAFIRVFLNGEQVFEFIDPNGRIMSVDTFEYLDLDGDDTGEILISAYTDANCRPYSDVLCLKQTEGRWKRMDIPLNGNGNNEFSFRITRGKEEFDFVISSNDMGEEIHYDASHYFVDDESGNFYSIQAYRSNHYQEGDEVGFISAWGIWSARAGTYEGKDCVIALQGIEGPYGHGLGQLEIYFAYDGKGKVIILKVEYLTD